MAEVPNTPIWETWESALLKTMSVGADIQEAIRQGKIPNIDKIAVIPRGGLFVVDVLARQLGLSGDKVLSIGLSKYSRDDPKHAGEFKKGQMPTAVDVEGQVILLGDEVFDTCETAVRAKSILLELGALSVITAAIHYKPGKNETDFVPDFYAELTDGWVHYPWEVIDPIGTLHRLATNGSHP
jgi:hypoxanthine phosphoribosyltransferase